MSEDEKDIISYKHTQDIAQLQLKIANLEDHVKSDFKRVEDHMIRNLNLCEKNLIMIEELEQKLELVKPSRLPIENSKRIEALEKWRKSHVESEHIGVIEPRLGEITELKASSASHTESEDGLRRHMTKAEKDIKELREWLECPCSDVEKLKEGCHEAIHRTIVNKEVLRGHLQAHKLLTENGDIETWQLSVIYLLEKLEGEKASSARQTEDNGFCVGTIKDALDDFWEVYDQTTELGRLGLAQEIDKCIRMFCFVTEILVRREDLKRLKTAPKWFQEKYLSQEEKK